MPRWWTCFAAIALLPALGTAAPPDPLRLIPKQAGITIVVENPRRLAESFRDLDAYQSALSLPVVREAFDSTAARRLFQLVGYYERELGAKWPELLDRIAGGGVAVGVAFAEDPAPALFVIQGRDEAAVGEFYRLALELLEQELTRQAAGGTETQKIRRATHRGIETIHVGTDFHAARVGTVIYLANHEKALQAALTLKPGESVGDRPGPRAARTLLGGDPLAWLWVDFARVKEQKPVQDFFETSRKDLLQTLVIGSSVDAFRRSDFLAAGLWRTPQGFRAALRLPARRADLPPEFALHAPPAGQPGSLPLLEPPGVVYSQSFYLDLATLWRERKKLLNDQVLKDVEKAERDISKVLPGSTLGQMLEMSGPYHRFVVAHRAEKLYAVRPDQDIPPMALVSSMRDPKFGKTAATALRSAAFLASFQTGLTMAEEKHDGVTIVSYRFPEKRTLPEDLENLRFNFVPCFAIVGEFLVVGTDPRLIKDLIPELRKPPVTGKGPAPVWRSRTYAVGLAETIRANPDPVVTDAILREGVGLEQAKKQVAALATWAATLGVLDLSLDHQQDAYQLQLEWKAK